MEVCVCVQLFIHTGAYMAFTEESSENTSALSSIQNSASVVYGTPRQAWCTLETNPVDWWGPNRTLLLQWGKSICGEQRARESGKRTSVRTLRGWVHHAFGSCCNQWPVERFTGWGKTGFYTWIMILNTSQNPRWITSRGESWRFRKKESAMIPQTELKVSN